MSAETAIFCVLCYTDIFNHNAIIMPSIHVALRPSEVKCLFLIVLCVKICSVRW
jgi:hypothetical protein